MGAKGVESSVCTMCQMYLMYPGQIWMLWKDYYEELLNLENPRIERGEVVVMDGKVDPIRNNRCSIHTETVNGKVQRKEKWIVHDDY